MFQQETSHLTEALFENSPDAILVVDQSGRTVRANLRACEMFGYRKSELEDVPLEKLLPERYRKRHVSLRGQYSENPHVRRMGEGLELFGLRNDGSEFPVDIMLSPVEVDGDKLVIAVVRDVTDRKRLESSLRYSAATFQTLFNHTFQFITLLTPDGMVKEVNKAKLDVIGATHDEVHGSKFVEGKWWDYSTATREQVESAVDKARNGEFVRFETQHFNVDGDLISVDFSLKPVKDEAGNVLSLIAEGRDITDLKRLMEQREDYVATLTHDLKTPILAANRAIKLLVDGDFGELNTAQSQILRTILDSNDGMFNLVRTLLDVYRYESGVKTLDIGEYDLAQFAAQLVEELKPIAEEKKISILTEFPSEPVMVKCDADEIRRVMQNVIDNAFKYTPDGGRVCVTLKREGEQISCSVADNGRGISESDQNQLFQRFWKQGSGGRQYASTGLGLYLCRKIVELHGGKIGCTSKLGEGSAFTFTLPLASDK
jgi:protein-histidine pros-kinase